MAKILVTGGCGYIGSHTIISLINHGYEAISADNLINSFPQSLDAVRTITGVKVKNYCIDLCDIGAVTSLFESEKDIKGIIHFAALKAVRESVEKPFLYFRNNLNSLINILEAASIFGVKNFIFSSSCSVYGDTKDLPVTELTQLKEAASPYGRTKQIGESIVRDASGLKEINALSLRYFNPAGGHPSGKLGEASRVKALNLIPVITETAAGKREKCFIHGNDYPTRDGTCIRDYIHVMDLADAHTLALNYIIQKQNSALYEVFNLGIGNGVSVLEAIQAFEKVSGHKLHYQIGPRRTGDVVAIYSDYSKAKNQLGWEPKYSIEDIMETAWKWEQNRHF